MIGLLISLDMFEPNSYNVRRLFKLGASRFPTRSELVKRIAQGRSAREIGDRDFSVVVFCTLTREYRVCESI